MRWLSRQIGQWMPVRGRLAEQLRMALAHTVRVGLVPLRRPPRTEEISRPPSQSHVRHGLGRKLSIGTVIAATLS